MSLLHLWHGWGMHPSAWNDLAALLTPRGIGARAPALPGYAGTAPAAPYTIDALVDTLLADLPAPITLCGWSLGAMLAMYGAQRHPKKIGRLILIGATPSFVQRPGWPHGITTQALVEFSKAVDSDPKSALKRFIALFNQNDVNSRSIGRALTGSELPCSAVLSAGLALLRDTDLRELVPKIAQPTLLLHGGHDPLMPLAAATWLASTLPQARLEVFPDAAHVPFLSAPACCAKLMEDFIHA